MKLRNKKTGEIYIVNGSYADREKGTVQIYLANLDKRPIGNAMLPEIMRDYEVAEGPRTVYDLKFGDECWTVFCPESGYTPVRIKFNKMASTLRETGSLYLTEEEARRDIDREKAKEILRRDAKGFEPDWKRADQIKWFAEYNHVDDDLETFWDDMEQHIGTVYFATEEDLKESFKKHPKEWLTVLEVEE